MIVIDILGDEEDKTPEKEEVLEDCEVCGRPTGGCCTVAERRTQLQIINIKGEVVPAP